MAFNINDFKSKVFSDKYNGFSRPNLFVMRIYNKDNSDGVGADLSFFCTSITLPGINLNTMEYRPDTNGLGQMMPVGIQYSPINAVLMLDDNHKILSFFHEWMQSVYNYSAMEKLKPRAGDPRHFPHEIGYKSEYSCQMEILQFSAGNVNSFYKCSLDGVYPYEIAPIELSWAADSQISTVAVQFSYSAVRMQGARTGKVPNYYLVDGTETVISNNNLRDSNIRETLNRIGTTTENAAGLLKNLFS